MSNNHIPTSNTMPSAYKYDLNFSYFKRKNNRNRDKNLASPIERYHTQNSNQHYEKVRSYLQQSVSLVTEKTVKSQSLSLDDKAIKQNFTQRCQEPNFYFKSFPKRKLKCKELHFFKLLKKYAGKDFFNEQQKSKVQLFSPWPNQESQKRIKPYLKTKLKKINLKERYFQNHEKEGLLYASNQKLNPGKSLVTIKVQPLKRKF